jgi:hypothetical protein
VVSRRSDTRLRFVASMGACIVAMLIGFALLLIPTWSAQAELPQTNGLLVTSARSARKTLKLPWALGRVVGPKSLRIVVRLASCIGTDAKPLRVNVRSAPGRAVITVIRTVDQAEAPKQCRREIRKRTLTVQLPSEIAETQLFDGSYMPPKAVKYHVKPA